MSERRTIPEPGHIWQRIAVGFCEWLNGDRPDDDDIEEARPAAKHIATYVEPEIEKWCSEAAAAYEGWDITAERAREVEADNTRLRSLLGDAEEAFDELLSHSTDTGPKALRAQGEATTLLTRLRAEREGRDGR